MIILNTGDIDLSSSAAEVTVHCRQAGVTGNCGRSRTDRLTRCLHHTAGCTIGWVNYASEPSQAALERSSQDAYGVIGLTGSKAAAWTVDDVARLIETFKKEFLFIYILPSVAYDPEG